jgi:hypothetical protein
VRRRYTPARIARRRFVARFVARFAASALGLSALSCGAATSVGRTSGAAQSDAPCPSALFAALPRDARDRLSLHVQRIFAHPRMASLVAAFVDDAGERAMMLRAERYGYDARTLDRAVIAWTVRGSTLYVARGSVDGRVIADRLYERLVGPRQRSEDRARNVRVTGELGSGPVALVVRPACGVLAYVEGREGALVDRVLSRASVQDADEAGREDPASAIYWRTTRAVEDAPPEGAALLRYVRAIEVRADPLDRGLDVELWLEGALPDDAEAVVRRVAAELAQTPLGELSGAVQWTAPSRLSVTREASRGVRARTVVPWGALEALASALAGRV